MERESLKHVETTSGPPPDDLPRGVYLVQQVAIQSKPDKLVWSIAHKWDEQPCGLWTVGGTHGINYQQVSSRCRSWAPIETEGDLP